MVEEDVEEQLRFEGLIQLKREIENVKIALSKISINIEFSKTHPVFNTFGCGGRDSELTSCRTLI